MQALKSYRSFIVVTAAYILLALAMFDSISTMLKERHQHRMEMLKKLERLERQTRELVDDTAQVQSMVDELVKRSESAK